MHPNLRRTTRILVTGLCLATCALRAQTLLVAPAKVMRDEPTTIRVTGLQPHQHANIQAELVDGKGHPWASNSEFEADASGAIDTSTQAPVKGSYKTVSAMGPVWSMKPTSNDANYYEPPASEGVQKVTFHLAINGQQVAHAQLEQVALRDNVRQVKLTGILHGILFLPPEPGPHPAMLVVGGSEGGVPLDKAVWLASHGYVALALAYFHYEDLPPDLQFIPLEYFSRAISWIMQRPEVNPDQIAVVGTGRGAELALQLGSMYSQIHAVVAYSPANIRYPGCCVRTRNPAWMLNNAALAYNHMAGQPLSKVMEERIAVEKTQGPILLITGGDEGPVWPTDRMADDIERRLDIEHFAYRHVQLKYREAGHRVAMPGISPTWAGETRPPVNGEATIWGGSPQGNAESTLDADPKILDFLRQTFPATPPNPANTKTIPSAGP